MDAGDNFGVPEFTELGKRIEMLRIERGLSKQHLARFAGTSRQQLWRVMTGKSELTGPLKLRLADALAIGTRELEHGTPPRGRTAPAPHAAPASAAQYLRDEGAISRTLATFPDGAAGQQLKRRYLDILEDLSLAEGAALGTRFFDLRRRVVAGQL